MGYLAAAVMREAKSMTALRNAYEKQLAELPKGSLRVKKRNDREYFYLAYRHENKVISRYVGNDKSKLGELIERIERRKNIENLLRAIKKELALMNKVLETIK